MALGVSSPHHKTCRSLWVVVVVVAGVVFQEKGRQVSLQDWIWGIIPQAGRQAHGSLTVNSVKTGLSWHLSVFPTLLSTGPGAPWERKENHTPGAAGWLRWLSV